MTLIIGGLQKTTLLDYPGKIAAAIFTSGCNFRCPYCHNPELVDPRKMKKQPRISSGEIFDFLHKRKGKLEGVCVTGGEPTLHPDLPEFLKKIKKMGFSVKLDTNGSNPEMLENLIKNKSIDYAAMDVKAPIETQNVKRKTQNNKYEQLFGIKGDLNKIKESIKILMNSGIDYEFRTTAVKDFHTHRDILGIARSIKGAKKYYLQSFNFHNKLLKSSFKSKRPFSLEEMQKMAEKCGKFVRHCEARE